MHLRSSCFRRKRNRRKQLSCSGINIHAFSTSKHMHDIMLGKRITQRKHRLLGERITESGGREGDGRESEGVKGTNCSESSAWRRFFASRFIFKGQLSILLRLLEFVGGRGSFRHEPSSLLFELCRRTENARGANGKVSREVSP